MRLNFKNMLYSAQLPSWGMCTIRYPRGNGIGLPWKEAPYEEIPVGKAQLLNDGKDVALLSIGTAGLSAADAVKKAEKLGISVLHYDMRFLKPLDLDAMRKASECKTIITLEDASVVGGLFSAVSEYIASEGLPVKVVHLGIPDHFVEQGTVAELKAECGYDEEGILKTILNVTQKG